MKIKITIKSNKAKKGLCSPKKIMLQMALKNKCKKYIFSNFIL